MISKDGVQSNVLPEYVLVFQPPLIIHNVLPYPITVILADSSTQDPPSFIIGVGGFVEVYQFDMLRKIRMSINMTVCAPSCAITSALRLSQAYLLKELHWHGARCHDACLQKIVISVLV